MFIVCWFVFTNHSAQPSDDSLSCLRWIQVILTSPRKAWRGEEPAGSLRTLSLQHLRAVTSALGQTVPERFPANERPAVGRRGHVVGLAANRMSNFRKSGASSLPCGTQSVRVTGKRSDSNSGWTDSR